jgi:hypothetical protein
MGEEVEEGASLLMCLVGGSISACRRRRSSPAPLTASGACDDAGVYLGTVRSPPYSRHHLCVAECSDLRVPMTKDAQHV